MLEVEENERFDIDGLYNSIADLLKNPNFN